MQPLDDFCRVIHKEILRIIGHKMPIPETWLLSEENHPLVPESFLTASELMKLPVRDVRRIITKISNVKLSTRNLHARSGPPNGNNGELKTVTVAVSSGVDYLLKSDRRNDEMRSMIPSA